MSANVVFFAWNRSIPGREETSAQHFQEFVGYLQQQQAQGAIDSFSPVFLNTHGGDLNGFFLIHGGNDALDALVASDDWVRHMMRAALHLEGAGAIRGVTGDQLMQRMGMWREMVSS